MGYSGLLEKPWSFKDDRIVRNVIKDNFGGKLPSGRPQTSFGRPPASEFTPRTRFYPRTSFYRPSTR
jgi:hypothetical protein